MITAENPPHIEYKKTSKMTVPTSRHTILSERNDSIERDTQKEFLPLLQGGLELIVIDEVLERDDVTKTIIPDTDISHPFSQKIFPPKVQESLERYKTTFILKDYITQEKKPFRINGVEISKELCIYTAVILNLDMRRPPFHNSGSYNVIWTKIFIDGNYDVDAPSKFKEYERIGSIRRGRIYDFKKHHSEVRTQIRGAILSGINYLK